MMIYKCTRCDKVSWSENGFECPVCGAKTVGFKRPKIEDDFDPAPKGVKLVLCLIGFGVFVISMVVVTVLAMAM